MLVVPSIDVRGGLVVRLVRGEFARETVFGDDPVATVEGFAAAGARRVHIVDLDAARGHPDEASTAAVRAAVTALAERGVDAQVGGGVRGLQTAQAWVDAGAAYVVVGSLAVRDPHAAAALCAALPHRVLAGLDVSQERARAEGWTVDAGDAMTHLQRWSSWPLAGVVHTAIERDGTLSGPSLEALRAVCAAFPGDVLASGGVTTARRRRRVRGGGSCRGDRRAGAPPGDLRPRRRAAALRRRGGLVTLAKRVIPCLDVDNGRVVKGVHFVDLRDAGDPAELAARYDADGADELVFLDITASSDSRDILLDAVRATADSVFIPLTVGGGIRGLADIDVILRAGADKVSLNTAVLAWPRARRRRGGAVRRAVRRRGGRRAQGRRRLDGLLARRPPRHRARRRGVGARGRRARRR